MHCHDHNVLRFFTAGCCASIIGDTCKGRSALMAKACVSSISILTPALETFPVSPAWVMP